jgi:hypothetical protein
MSIVRQSDEITTIIYDDGSCEVYRRNDFNSPYQFKGDSVVRWHKWLHILETADKYPALSESIEAVELMYEIVKDQ